jgi:hypothetical protein
MYVAGSAGKEGVDVHADRAKFSPVQAVWGHAALGAPAWNGTKYAFPAESTLRHIDRTVGGGNQSEIPANEWHLSRRQTILAFNVSPPGPDATGKVGFVTSGGPGDDWVRITRCEQDDTLVPPMPGDLVYFDFNAMLAAFSVPAPSDPTYPGPPSWSPYDLFGGSFTPSWFPPYRTDIEKLLYFGGTPGAANHHVATVLTEVPVALRNNLGVQMLPGCAWFQVEFLMPEDPRNSVLYTDPRPDSAGGGLFSSSYDLPQWTSIVPGQTYVFVPDSTANRGVVSTQVNPANGIVRTGSRLSTFGRLDQKTAAVPGTDADPARGGRIVRMWPYALRITIHAYDGRGRLEQPIVRSIVHRFE